MRGFSPVDGFYYRVVCPVGALSQAHGGQRAPLGGDPSADAEPEAIGAAWSSASPFALASEFVDKIGQIRGRDL